MIDVMKQALEALEYHQEQTRPIHKTQETITALRQAIEQAKKQEPKAWIYEGNLHIFDPTDWAIEPESVQPLYTAPTKREWVGLTDDEIIDAFDPFLNSIEKGRAIEQRLKEKNT
jgi:hypothetical protein